MKLLLYGDIPASWPEQLKQVAPEADIAVTSDADVAVREIADAEAFYGQITPAMLHADCAGFRRRWPAWRATSLPS